jgi:hypothetical protein
MVAAIPEVLGGDFGWFQCVAGAILSSRLRTKWRLNMSSNIPVLPIAGGTLVRALLALVALVTSWLKRRDAFSEPFWDDPTALLRERAIERRMGFPRASRTVAVENGFRRPPTDRPARQAI